MEYDRVFTPGAPVKQRHFLFGRDQEVGDLRRYLRRPGLHPIVIGNRGVGKTSVVIQGLSNFSPKPIRVNCSPEITFSRLAHLILQQIGVEADEIESSREDTISAGASAKPLGIGVDGGTVHKRASRSEGLAQQNVDALTLFNHLRKNEKFIIVLDEYDAIPARNAAFHASLAYLIKLLADHSDECDSRIVVVGVAQSSKDLLGRHASIERSAREIYLNPLRRQDVLDFLIEAERQLRTTFQDGIKEGIARESGGYPYYAHLVGLECLDAMKARDRRATHITEEDYGVAVERAVSHAFRSELRKYRSAILAMSPQEKNIIAELSALPQRPRRTHLEDVVVNKGLMSAAEFNHALLRIQQERRFLYLQRDDDTIRFSDPLMWVFLRRLAQQSRSRRARSSGGPVHPTGSVDPIDAGGPVGLASQLVLLDADVWGPAREETDE